MEDGDGVRLLDPPGLRALLGEVETVLMRRLRGGGDDA